MNKSEKTQYIGKYEIKKPSIFRQLTIASFEAIPQSHNMISILEFDITKIREKVREDRRIKIRTSVLAYVIKAIATTIKEYKEINVIKGKNNFYYFEDVDINMPIETKSEGEYFPRQIIIRNANLKSEVEICGEIEEAKRKFETIGHLGREDRNAIRMMKILLLLPKFIRNIILRTMINNPIIVKKMSGTVFLTSINTTSSGHIIPFIAGPKTVYFAIGGIRREIQSNGATKEMMGFTIVFNHEIIDGAYAARFCNKLKKNIEL